MNAKTFKLTVNKGPHLGKTFELAKEKVTIGRDSAADVTFDIAEVSRSHAAITRRGDEYFIADLGSTNGTYINQKRITGQQRLQSGDTIMLSDAVHLNFISQFDPGATVVATPSFMKEESGTKPAMPAVPKPKQPAPSPPQQQYAGRVPSGPAMSPPSPVIPEEEGKKKTWLWAGLGCLAVVIFFLVIGLVAFDYMNLYCTPPFDRLLSFLYTCP
ncbi:MAG: Oxoglutarate dehydrogenase inhibitor [Chloroflexi bacterium]|nr:Oxoglutarate dehydrogenase inhibitor [Chloroflexota bacterium]